ncbi:MAG: DNA polymerase III subunit epsilon [Pseudobacteriovorax sp.]|nr:DNA polymerase III subunit epsilon [Pseudobacteriovorax sp.]
MDIGLIVDLETTGIDSKNDKIIEIGILEFLAEDGVEPMITNMYSELEDPGEPISEEIQSITGINDDMVAGRQIDWSRVRELFGRADIIIAHNADFDRGFLEARPELAGIDIHWGCSVKHIDWHGHGFKTRALNYLAADMGFVNPFAHRALFDCATTFRLVSPYLKELITRSFMKEYKLLAVGAPFAVKDKLREAAYRWDAQQRVWGKTVFEDRLDAEREFLASEIYQGSSRHEEHSL